MVVCKKITTLQPLRWLIFKSTHAWHCQFEYQHIHTCIHNDTSTFTVDLSSFTIVLLRWPSKVRSRHLLGCNSLKSLDVLDAECWPGDPTFEAEVALDSLSPDEALELCVSLHTSTLLLQHFFSWGRAIPSSFRIYCGRAVLWQRFFGWGVGGNGLWKNPSNFQQKPLIEANSFIWWLCIIQLQGPTSWLKMAGKIQEIFYTSWNLKLTFSHLKMDGWNSSFLLGWPIFRCENVSFTECYGSSSLVVFLQVVAKKDGEGTL